MTAFGEQPSVVIATAGGSLVKCNSDAWIAAAEVGNDDGEDDRTAGPGEGNVPCLHCSRWILVGSFLVTLAWPECLEDDEARVRGGFGCKGT